MFPEAEFQFVLKSRVQSILGLLIVRLVLMTFARSALRLPQRSPVQLKLQLAQRTLVPKFLVSQLVLMTFARSVLRLPQRSSAQSKHQLALTTLVWMFLVPQLAPMTFARSVHRLP